MAKPIKYPQALVRCWVYCITASALCILPGEAWSQLTSASIDGASPLEQFKAFIASPPVISNLVFQQKVSMDGGIRPLDGSFALSKRYELFQARWQTNGLFFRRLNNLSSLTNFDVEGRLVSWSGHLHTLFEPRPLLTTWDDRDPSALGKSISIFYTSEFFLQPFKEILNLGIMHAGFASVRWRGNQFLAECNVDHEHLQIAGELSGTAEGRADRLEVHYMFRQITNDYLVRYYYNPPLKYNYLPTVIRNYWLKKEAKGVQKEIELDEWRILDIEIAKNPLPDIAFEAAPFIHQNQWPERLYTNGAFYARGTNGEYRFVGSLEPHSQRRLRSPRTQVAAFYTSWVVLNVAIFALMVGAIQTEHKKTSNNTKK